MSDGLSGTMDACPEAVRIICGTDFSERAMRAAQVSAQLARRFDDAVRLVHALEPDIQGPTEVAGASPSSRGEAVNQASTQLERLAETLRKQRIPVETQVREGYADDVLLQEGRDSSARLIVVATQGRSPVARWFLGSVAIGLLRRADRPVIVVRDDGHGIEEWAVGRRPLRVLANVDRTQASKAALGWIRSLRRAGPVELSCVHLYWPPEEYGRLGLEWERDRAKADAEVREVIEREVRQGLDSSNAGTTRVEIHPTWGRPGWVLADMMVPTAYDLAVVGLARRRALAPGMSEPRVAEDLTRLAHVPVVCVPESLAPVEPTQGIPEMKRVLVATDFSQLGNRAVRHALGLVREGGSVHLCHVLERHDSARISPFEGPEDAARGSRRQAVEAQLRALVSRDGAVDRGVEAHCEVVEGADVADALVQAATRIGADAICMASHGRGAVATAMLGSVAAAVLHRAPCPVFLVGPRPGIAT